MGETSGRILAVSSDEAVTEHLVRVLEHASYEIAVARSARDALTLSRSTNPDLILLDEDLADSPGHRVCHMLKDDPEIRGIPVILIIDPGAQQNTRALIDTGAADFLTKPFNPPMVLARVRTHLALSFQSRRLEELVASRTQELEKTQEALREAMHNLMTTQVTPGVFWIQIPEAGLYILCGSPGEVVKHLARKGYIRKVTRDGVTFETGPNVILLSDLPVQNGEFANLAEFPVLQMLYRQGMMIPNHPNNTGRKPMLLGSDDQIHAQLEYIHRGNYGLVNEKEIMACGVDAETADTMMRIKRNFAFGEIRSPREFLDTLVVEDAPREIRAGVTVCRTGLNRFRFEYRNQSTDVDLNLPNGMTYERPYLLDNHRCDRHYFAVLHTGDGDGWDVNRPAMGSVIMYQGRIFLIDAGPSILGALTALGIDISEVEGIFHTHCHDDHFGGLPALAQSDHRIKYYATQLVRESVVKKLSALMSLGVGEFERFFEIHDLVFDRWNDCDGLEVMPIFSPHPVETNLFLFRALDENGYRSYAHWADLSSFEVLDRMTEPGPNQVSKAVIDKVKSDYLCPVDLKKLDIGGGMIHGMAKDFRRDRSQRLILAHIDRNLTLEEMEIGSESSFGAVDVLIRCQQDYHRKMAFDYLRLLFPEVRKGQFLALLNAPVIQQNAGTIIRRAAERSEHMDMILSGRVAYINTAKGIHNNLSFGSFLGDHHLLYSREEDMGTYRAVSHCTVMRLSNTMVRTFLETNQLFDQMKELTTRVWSLRTTWLFGDQTSFLALGNITRDLNQISLDNGERLEIIPGEAVWLVESGALDWCHADGRVIQRIYPSDFFGEHSYILDDGSSDFSFQASSNTVLLRISMKLLFEIPIIYWKILETINKRQNMLLSHDNAEDENNIPADLMETVVIHAQG